MGQHVRTSTTLLEAVLASRRYRSEEARVRARAGQLLELVGLGHRAGTPARELAYGDQRRLEIARALAAEPRLLLLDEPAAGMNPAETHALMALIQRLRRELNLSILLIEHDMKVVMGVCDRIAVLNFGQKIAQGTPPEVRSDPAVIEAYLGGQTGKTAAQRRSPGGEPVLSVEGVSSGYGPVEVLHQVASMRDRS